MKQAFLDIDTQIDFLFPAGALYVPGAEKLIPAIARLNRHAAQNGIPLISTMCAHAENDAEFLEWPAHCVTGTVGQLKPAVTMQGDRQVILEKQQLDLFSNPNTKDLLLGTGADEFLVYGVVTEYCVRFAASGVLNLGKRVLLVTDAIQAIDAAESQRFLDDMRSRGAGFITASSVTG